jgi:hypothetical protein
MHNTASAQKWAAKMGGNPVILRPALSKLRNTKS